MLAHSYSFFDSASTAAAILRTGCCVGKICWWYTDFRARFAGNTGTFFRRNFRELLYHVRPMMRPFASILLPIFILLSAFFHVLRHRKKRRRVAVLRVNFFVRKTADGRTFLFLIHASQRAARHRVPAPVPAPRSRSRTRVLARSRSPHAPCRARSNRTPAFAARSRAHKTAVRNERSKNTCTRSQLALLCYSDTDLSNTFVPSFSPMRNTA